MKTINALLAAGILALSSIATAQTTKVSEPIFGIQYDPNAVHFERIPSIVNDSCKDLRGKKAYVYARLSDRDTEYFVVQEYLGEFGVAVAIRGRNCTEVDLDRFLYEGAHTLAPRGIAISEADEHRISDEVATAILNQYSSAFGGKQQFLKALGTGGDTLPKSSLRTKLQQFRNNR